MVIIIVLILVKKKSKGVLLNQFVTSNISISYPGTDGEINRFHNTDTKPEFKIIGAYRPTLYINSVTQTIKNATLFLCFMCNTASKVVYFLARELFGQRIGFGFYYRRLGRISMTRIIKYWRKRPDQLPWKVDQWVHHVEIHRNLGTDSFFNVQIIPPTMTIYC